VSLLSRLLGRDRPPADDVAAAVTRTVAGVPGVSGTFDIAYTWLQYGSGSLSGGVDVDSRETYGEALDAAYTALEAMLGETALRVVVYLSGRGPDGTPYDGGSLGLPTQPTGRDLAERLG
jgi:hypothetical protein